MFQRNWFDRPRCIIDDNLDNLMSQMVDHLHRMRESCCELANENGMVLKELDYRINELGKVVDVREVDNDGMMEMRERVARFWMRAMVK